MVAIVSEQHEPVDESRVSTAPVPADKQTPTWLGIAEHELGVHELYGPTDNTARIMEYLATTNLPEAMKHVDETAWCSAFANWCMLQAGIRGTNSAAARSWLAWGMPIILPKRGCVVVLSRDNAGPLSGHVGFFLETTTKVMGPPWKRVEVPFVRLLGGNQSNKVCAAEYPASRLLAYRWPLV